MGDAMSLAPGTMLSGKYRVAGMLHETETRRIYGGTTFRGSRAVAIHVMRDSPQMPAASPVAIEWFFNEAKLQATVHAENVADVYDAGRNDDGMPFMITEPLDGWWLSGRIAEGALPAAEAVMWLEQVLDALGSLHEKGIIHRDLKPSHMAFPISAGGNTLKLVGLGVARRVEAASALEPAGAMLGTPVYMSPEQVVGLPDIDARTDIWSWGVSLFEGLTGRLPFVAEGLGDLIVKITIAPIPDLTIAGVPPALQAILIRCLERDRKRRFQSAAEVRAALDAARPTFTS
jgi:serine/threonine-protein kinase